MNRRALTTPIMAFLCSTIAAVASISAGGQRSSDGGFDRAIREVIPRVVKLYGLGAGLEQGYGSGVLISDDGLVVTVLSLLIDARKIRAVTADGTLYQATVVYRDDKRQIALLQLSSPTREAALGQASEGGETGKVAGLAHFGLDCRELGESQSPCVARLSPGDWVIAAGNAFKVADGAETVSIAHGVFSARTRLDARRRMRDFAYTGDVLVIDGIVSNPGAPGGAIVNLDGQLVGMIGREVISNLTHTHLNYGIPVEVLKEVVDAYQKKQSGDTAAEATASMDRPKDERSPDLGIRLSKTGYQAVLPYVERVQRESAAAKLGVRKDDLILSINGRNVSSVEEYDGRLQAVQAGEEVVLIVRRGREILSFRFLTSSKEGNP